MELIENSLTSTLIQVYGHNPTQIDQWLGATSACEEEANLLRIDVGSPILLITTLAHLEDGTPIEYAQTRCIGERLRLRLHVKAHGENNDLLASVKVEPITKTEP